MLSRCIAMSRAANYYQSSEVREEQQVHLIIQMCVEGGQKGERGDTSRSVRVPFEKSKVEIKSGTRNG